MRLAKQLRGHAHFFLVIVPLILLMTYPTIIHVFDPSSFWLPALDWDVWLKFWDAWHFKQVLAGKSEFLHTNLLFYPDGVSLAYRAYSLPHIIIMSALSLLMPASHAFSLTYLLLIFACAAAAYVYCSWLFKDKWLALLGAVVFGFSQHVIGRAHQPDTSFIAALPLTLYFLHRGFDEERIRLLAIAGVLLGFTAYCGLYILVCNAITVAAFLALFARFRFRDAKFWRGLLLLGALALVVSSGRLLPVISDPAAFDRALQSRTEQGSDALELVVNKRHPILSQLHASLFEAASVELSQKTQDMVHNDSYLGFATLLWIGIGLLRKVSRKSMLPWLCIASAFLILRLGSTLQIGAVHYSDIPLPKHALNQLLPSVFAAFHNSAHFQVGLLLPLAVMACYGLRAVLPSASKGRRATIVLLAVALVAFDLYLLPYAQEIEQEQFQYADWLKAQTDQDSIRLLELPLNAPESLVEFRMLHQSIHGYPRASGTVARLSPAAYDYMNENALLSAWREGQAVVCSGTRRGEILAALDHLLSDGFSHVRVNIRRAATTPMRASFADITPAYVDEFNSMYQLSQLRQHCHNPPPGTDSLALHLELVYGDVMPPLDVPVLTFHPAERINADALRYLSWNEGFGQNLNHATLDDAGRFTLQSTNPEMRAVDDFVAKYDHSAILFIHAPEASEAQDAAWTDWLTSRFKLCGRVAENAHLAIDHYLRLGMPCELVTAASPLHATFDNGAELRNRVVEMDGGELHVSLWWKVARFPKTSYSIQLFDDSGERARQIDHVMSAPVETRAIDLWDLPAGEYHARLIVYDFQTGASHGGEVMADGTRFQRDIEIARFIWDP